MLAGWKEGWLMTWFPAILSEKTHDAQMMSVTEDFWVKWCDQQQLLMQSYLFPLSATKKIFSLNNWNKDPMGTAINETFSS